MKNVSTLFVAGFAVFSMFFGSGNLVFPLQIGVESGQHYLWASLGLFLTGILIPFMGLLSILIKASHGTEILTRIGRIPGLVLVFMMLSLMGPFGVGARCILVAYGGFHLLWPHLPLGVFSLGFCALTGYIVWKKNVFVQITGRYLSPLLLGGIALIILFGLYAEDRPEPSSLSSTQAVWTGITYGYQTMDLLAAFFFSGTVLGYLRFAQRDQPRPVLIRNALLSCGLGIFLLTAVYVGFVALGAFYAPHLTDVNPEHMLVQIAGKTLGVFAMPIMSLTIMLACLTTFLVLTNLFAEFIHTHGVRKKISLHWSVLLTLVITFCVAQCGFKLLAIWIAEALSVAYPALIVLALTSIVKDSTGLSNRVVSFSFYGTLALSVLFKLLKIGV